MTTDISLDADRAAWLPAFLRRLADGYRAEGLAAPAAEHLAEQQREQTEKWTLAAVREGGRTVGYAAVAVTDRDGSPVGRIGEVWTEPGRTELRPAVLAWAERWCAERGGRRIEVRVVGSDPLFDRYAVRGQTRVKELAATAVVPGGVTARPMTAGEYPLWRAEQDDAYVADIVRSGSHTEPEARAKSAADFARLLPEEMATRGHAFLVLEADGGPIGTGWLLHGFLPGVTFGYSLDVRPELRGRGFGRAAMAVGEQAVLAAGDRALMFNVFGGNEVAMGLYTSAGYRVLEESRSRDVSGGPAA
ncbi:ribosomal protein S18 acetylase RimI-like enzyme [Streptomyces sp. TLI_235]|nr:GNAT family N-acetyltransferase [Streptomyces sp. TLI_235]PBC80064.1 ribosomal protein S18 acetylase RimI-like enzyme [Streptomyces sp. TLI_235]